MGVSNNVTAVVNFLALLCSIPIIGAGIWLASNKDNECVHLVRWPVVILGVLILLVSLADFVGAYWNHQCLLAAYLFAMAVLIVLLALLVFTFAVTHPDGSYDIPGRAYKEYRLAGFSSWLRDHVTSAGSSSQIRTCLSAADVCGKLGQRYLTPDQFFQADLTPLQAFYFKKKKKFHAFCSRTTSTGARGRGRAGDWAGQKTLCCLRQEHPQGDGQKNPSVAFARNVPRVLGLIYICTWLQVLRETFWDANEKLSCLNNTALTDLKAFIRQLLSQLYIEGLCHGNLSEEEAVNIANTFMNTFSALPLSVELRHQERVLSLPAGASLIRRVRVKNELEPNSVVEGGCQGQLSSIF